MDEAAPQTLVVSQWKCEVNHIGDIMAAMDSVARPVWAVPSFFSVYAEGSPTPAVGTR